MSPRRIQPETREWLTKLVRRQTLGFLNELIS